MGLIAKATNQVSSHTSYDWSSAHITSAVTIPGSALCEHVLSLGRRLLAKATTQVRLASSSSTPLFTWLLVRLYDPALGRHEGEPP